VCWWFFVLGPCCVCWDFLGGDCHPREHAGVALLPYQCVCLAALRRTVAEETGVEACESALDHESPKLLEQHEVVGVVARPVARFRRIKAIVEHKCLQTARLQHHTYPVSRQTHGQRNIRANPPWHRPSLGSLSWCNHHRQRRSSCSPTTARGASWAAASTRGIPSCPFFIPFVLLLLLVDLGRPETRASPPPNGCFRESKNRFWFPEGNNSSRGGRGSKQGSRQASLFEKDLSSIQHRRHHCWHLPCGRRHI
jgi:hypothetical protein